MNKELPYHTSHIVQRYLQLKKIAHYESGVIISIIVSLLILSLVFMGSHIGNTFSVEPINFAISTEGGGKKVLGIEKGGSELYGSLVPHLLLGKVEQIRGIWTSENNIMSLGNSSGTILPRYISSQYVFPQIGNWAEQEFEQYLQAISSISMSPIQDNGVKEELNWTELSSNFSCLGRTWMPSYFCQNKLSELVDIIPQLPQEQRKSAYSKLLEHTNDVQYQLVCAKILQTIVYKSDYSNDTKLLLQSCSDASTIQLYDQAKTIQEFHNFLDKPELVMSFGGMKDAALQEYVLVSMIQNIIQGIASDRDNVIILESFALTIDTLTEQNNIDRAYIGLLSYFNKSKLQPYFNAKVGATINQRETYDRITSSFKNLDKTVSPIVNVVQVVNTGLLDTERNNKIQTAIGVTPNRLIVNNEKVISLFVFSGKRYIMNILINSGNIVELYKSEPGVGNTKLEIGKIIFDTTNYPKLASLFAKLTGGTLDSAQSPKTESDWKNSFEKSVGSYSPQVTIRGDTIVIAFSKSSKKYAFVVNQTSDLVKLYDVGQNTGNKLIFTANSAWNTLDFSTIKPLIK